jgi:putative isomerase
MIISAMLIPILLSVNASDKTDIPTGVATMKWVTSAKRKLEPWKLELLQRSYDTLQGNIVKHEMWHNKRGIVPSIGRYDGVWNWDSAFHAMTVSRWDPELAREQAEILFGEQEPNGALPDVIYEDGRIVKESGKPPVYPWAIAIVEKRAPNKDFLKAIYPKLVKFEAFWRRERGGEEKGLYFYGGPQPHWESGWDNSVRWDDGVSNLYSIDLNCYMVMLYDAMVGFAKKLDLKQDLAQWQTRRKELAKRIETDLWDPKTGAYLDYNYEKKEFLHVLTPASFMPLYAGIASKEHAAAMAKLAADPKKFYPGVPTVSYDDPKFDANAYWRGPCWLNTAAFTIFGLEKYGYKDTASQMKETILKGCYDGGYPFEYYNPVNGKPCEGAAKKFGWSAAFIIELILE